MTPTTTLRSLARTKTALSLLASAILPIVVAAGCGGSGPGATAHAGTTGTTGMAGQGQAGTTGMAGQGQAGTTGMAGQGPDGGPGGAGGTTVMATLTSISVTPTNPMIAKGSPQQFVATGTFSDGTTKDLSASVTWNSATPATATITPAGLAMGLAKGTTVISATSGAVSGTTTLTVKDAALVSIAVTPTNPTIAKGTKQQFVATGTYDDGTTQDLSATVTWASATAATATISPTGQATGVDGGMSVISATSGAISGSTTLKVTAAKLLSIAVTPGTPTIATGTKQQFVATGTYDDTTTQNLSAMVTWASATVATATISDAAPTKGQASAVAVGTTIISATSMATAGAAAIVGTATLTVTKAALMSIAVTPATPSIAKGTKATFIATGTFADTTTQDLTTQVTWASATVATATISNAAGSIGQATSVAKGTTVISATLGLISGNTTLTVTDATVVSISVTPATPSIAKGTKGQFTATATYTDTTTQDVTAMATWASATAATATISNAAGTKGLATALVPGTSVISATVGAVSGNTTLTVNNGNLISIVVTPATPTIANGTTRQFVATGFFDNATRQDVTDSATWASATVARATISNAAGSKGLATAVSAGTSVISATIGPITANTTLTVTVATLKSIAITPPTPNIGKGTKVSLVATGTFTDNTTQDITTSVAWASATTTIATISNAAGSNGQVSGVAVGTSVITATMVTPTGTISTMVTLTVSTAVLASIAVTPATPAIAKGTTQQFVAVGTFTDSTTQVLTGTATWASATVGTATISNAAGSTGLATAVNVGTTIISATSGTIIGSTTLTVNGGVLVSIAVTPTTPRIAAGTKQQFVATGTFSAGGVTQDLTDSVTWASGTAATATISSAAGSDGLLTAVAPGMSVISATLGTIVGNTTLTVTSAQLVSIAITPNNAPTIADGTTLQFTATGFFNDASTQDLTDTVTWASAMPTIATISNAADSGLATGQAVGTTAISATVGLIVGTTNLRVTAAVLTSIAITPANPSIAKGTTQRFVATGTYSDGSTQILAAAATWASGTVATATISNAAASRGLATSVAAGETDISATSGAIVGHTKLTVTAAALVSIAVTPAAPSIAKGTTRQFVATGTYTDATTQNLSSSVTWASGTVATATISNAAGSKGLASSVAVGTTIISAASGAINGMTTLTVTAATLVSITVTPVAPSIARNATRQFIATGTYTDATTQDITAMVTWTSSVVATATVSNAAATKGLASGLAAGTTNISAASGAINGMTTLTVTP